MRFRADNVWHGENARWYAALGVSTLVHLVLVGLLGLFWLPTEMRDDGSPITSLWSPADSIAPVETLLPFLTTQTDHVAGGSPAPAILSIEPVEPKPPRNATTVAVGPLDLQAIAESAALAKSVPPLSGRGQGKGTGDGSGDGDGSGFFGRKPKGQRFVYVVDCSRSMNHPHPSEAKTRFRRVQKELIQSIGLMDSSQEFFVVFFNNGTLPMPAQTLRPAFPENKQHYLHWVAEIKAEGQPTDPRGAIALALRLQPDVIYFLTDGSFEHRVDKYLSSIRQRRTIIHTFAFGERDGEELLKELAANNGGEYHFIP